MPDDRQEPRVPDDRQEPRVPDDRQEPRLIARSASPEEAAAIVAAIDRFMRATSPPATAPREQLDRWRRAALLEGVSRDPWADVPDPWINT